MLDNLGRDWTVTKENEILVSDHKEKSYRIIGETRQAGKHGCGGQLVALDLEGAIHKAPLTICKKCAAQV